MNSIITIENHAFSDCLTLNEVKYVYDIESNPKTEVKVDLPEQKITNLATGETESFEINPYKKHCLMNALDDIEFLLSKKDDIEAWEKK